MKVLTKPFIYSETHTPESSLIFGTITKGIQFGSQKDYKRNHKDFMKTFDPYLKELLANSKIYVASSEEDPNFLLGYAIIQNASLEWIYVKPDFRKQGIATLLIKNKHITSFNEKNLTDIADIIMQKHEGLFQQQKVEQHD